ncbi:hypothetical protein N7468_004066 [Penicillium chermesinum]|uniref:Uncharacterized protein n=1 Tax=Penicillium chermesinum TaxID=63820 RepID=A0A9W9P7X6_9EURO|nr:uncharacterized protein N7468_004066 [Penicillium chermesinum]KAJ5239447.1 hypothetical protein N7468_004066 [Penicillium chermesinum]
MLLGRFPNVRSLQLIHRKSDLQLMPANSLVGDLCSMVSPNRPRTQIQRAGAVRLSWTCISGLDTSPLTNEESEPRVRGAKRPKSLFLLSASHDERCRACNTYNNVPK